MRPGDQSRFHRTAKHSVRILALGMSHSNVPPEKTTIRHLRPNPDLPALARKLRGDSTGAAAVEFALVSVPFLALLGALIQTAFSIWASQNFDYEFQKTARTLFTGQFQQQNNQSVNAAVILAAFKNNMCGSGSSSVVTMFNCNNVRVDISLGTNFAASVAAQPVDPNTRDWSSGFGSHYSCAKPGTIVVATAAVKFPVFFGSLNSAFSSFADGSQLLESTAVFRTEPYSAGASPC